MFIESATNEIEYEILDDQFLISRTDLDSHITYVNEAFVEVSGYTASELMGATNGLFRHPDMPDAVFDDIWATLNKKKIWSGVMKHRRKDGGFFWAHATISPIVIDGRTIGYTTVRIKPTPAHVASAIGAYAGLKNGQGRGFTMAGGQIVRTGWIGWLGRGMRPTVHARLTRMCWLSVAGLLCIACIQYFGQAAGYAAAMLFASLLVASWKLQGAVLAPLNLATDLCTKLSAGDLSEKITSKSADEIGWHIAGLNTMQKSLATMVRHTVSGTEAVNMAAGEINAGNAELSRQTEQQAASLQETTATLGHLAHNVKRNADSAEQARRLAAKASDIAARGGSDITHVVKRIRAVADSARKIESFIDLIDGVAFQTNVLALNATIEAARAGQQGRGFAVVAAEVRHLAQRSALAAKEIRDLIHGSNGEIAETGQCVEQTAITMDDIVRSVKAVSTLMDEVASASLEQSSGIEQISRAVTCMDEATQRSAAFVEQLAATASTLERQASSLKNSVAVFHL
jgi:aerotaxis receptor